MIAAPSKSVRVTRTVSGQYRAEISTPLPPSRSAILNLTDSVQVFDNLSFEALVTLLREAFPEIANP